MIIRDDILRPEERIAFQLRSLYSQAGFSQFKMSKFEEYDLYMRNKEFLISDGLITFNDPNGKLLALKPDVTLSIIKYARDIPGQVQRFYYTENVYRLSETDHRYKEIMQTGLECIGDTTREDTVQVVRLALGSAGCISGQCRTVFSHIGFVSRFLQDQAIGQGEWKALFEKNLDGLKAHCSDAQLAAAAALMATYPDARRAQAALLPHCTGPQTRQALDVFAQLYDAIAPEKAQVDFTLTEPVGYYSGIVFKSYHPGIARAILSGGEYSNLMQKMGRRSRAVGFAVYLDELERLEESQCDDYINIALPKGRLGEKVYAMFEKAGFDCPAIREENRRLVFENPEKKLRYFWVKPSDVAIYVARGAADLGVAGSDILMEYRPEVFELCDLGVGKCRMAVAAPKGFREDETKTLRVATKFTNIAQKYYAEKGRDIDIIHLNGSIELAPLLGLSDVIVDIVETGKTLVENGLEPREDITPISARLIANKAAYRFKKDIIEKIRIAMAGV